MSVNPFADDTTSNARTDFRFADDDGVPEQHLVSFQQAMGAPRASLAEEDYRYPPGAQGQPTTNTAQPPPAPGPAQRPGHYPQGYAP